MVAYFVALVYLLIHSIIATNPTSQKTFQNHGMNKFISVQSGVMHQVDSMLQCNHKCARNVYCTAINICKVGERFNCMIITEDVELAGFDKKEGCQALTQVKHGFLCRQYIGEKCHPCTCHDSVKKNNECFCDLPSYKIELKSGGYASGKEGDSYIKINNKKYLANKRGFTVFIIDSVCAKLSSNQTFDTWKDQSSSENMLNLIKSMKANQLIGVTVWGSAERYQPTDALETLGATDPLVGFRTSYALLALKGVGKLIEYNGMTRGSVDSFATIKLQWKYDQAKEKVVLTSV